MNRTQFNIIGFSLILGLFLACGNKPKTDYNYESAAMVFAADESFFPILDEELEIFEALHSQGVLKPIYTNQEEAITKLMKNETWLAFTTRRLSDREMENLKARKFVPRIIPIAYDGLAIIVNNSNPDTCITVKDFARILSGEVSQWKDIYPTSKLGEIDVVFDHAKSSTVTWCVDSILGGKPINSKNIGAVKKSSEVIDWVEKHQNAIGIIGSNWLNDKRDTTNVTFNKNVTVMKELSPAEISDKGVKVTLQAQPNEYFYGGGVQNGRFSHRGQQISIVNQNSWNDGGVCSPAPFYWSTAGYGMMFHTFKPGQYDFGAKTGDVVTLEHQTDHLDLFLWVADGPVALLNQYYQLTGRPVLLPLFGFYEGHLNAYNRDYWKESENGILFEDGKRYKESQQDIYQKREYPSLL